MQTWVWRTHAARLRGRGGLGGRVHSVRQAIHSPASVCTLGGPVWTDSDGPRAELQAIVEVARWDAGKLELWTDHADHVRTWTRPQAAGGVSPHMAHADLWQQIFSLAASRLSVHHVPAHLDRKPARVSLAPVYDFIGNAVADSLASAAAASSASI